MTIAPTAPEAAADNPLLVPAGLPAFDAVKPEHVAPALEAAIARHDAVVQAIVTGDDRGFDAVCRAMEAAEAELSDLWATVSHLHSVADTPELRAAHAAALERLIGYSSAVAQNPELYAAYAAVDQSALGPTERRLVDLSLRNFKLGGVALPPAERDRFAALQVELGRLQTAYSSAVLDATEAWVEHITDEALLAGVPAGDKAMLASLAAARNLDGWLVTLHQPSVRAILTYADNRDLRARVYRAYGTRASDQGLKPETLDNSERMGAILALRREAAALLGFKDPVDLSLATKMARSGAEVVDFLRDLARRARQPALADKAQLEAFARDTLGITTLQPWDNGYVAEKLRQALHNVDDQKVKAYFPLPRVLNGLLGLLRDVFGITLAEQPAPVWHPDARYYTLSRDGVPFAGLYMDLYARTGKKGGAWMAVCRARLKGQDGTQLPVAYLNCNFAPPAGGKPSLLSHGDVLTLLHEMGHCLHHVLSEVDYPSISGVTGFEWDAVELPSQLLENFAWDRQVLRSMSGHVDTGEPLPDDLFDAMLGAQRFQAALALLRQVEFALFDLQMHLDAGITDAQGIQALLERVRAEVAVLTPPEWHRFAHAFTHIFAGGYAAGYYSYLWAERLSLDGFGKFLEGDRAAAGEAFRTQVLAVGSSRPALDSYIAFRGREPQNDALLKRYGLAA
ncbi:M3 family metallopeptidase [Nitrospirillum pindoramense]|uniref:oligopeptidase A n=1 Tax=Nitrospirillum amazonense TaxID=28077 RepID=A0A560GVV8_9PROT|nr:M3 family metallopeptidase [Nitrospirillum amazonense]TWB37580.1 oligopeptidase A [Nitrospirillum amazonense]